MLYTGKEYVKEMRSGEGRVKAAFAGKTKIFPNYSLALGVSSLSFAAAGQALDLQIDCNDVFNWTISGLPAGFTVPKLIGTGPETVRITASNNTATAQRGGTITVSGHDLSASCVLTQAAGAMSTRLTLNSYNAAHPASGSSSAITGTYDTLWNGIVTASQANVACTLAITSGADGFSVSSNNIASAHRGTTVGGARTAAGTASYGSASASWSVTQAANAQTYVSLGVSASKSTGISAGAEQVTLYATAHYTYTSGSVYDPDVSASAAFSSSDTGIFTVSGRTAASVNRGTTEGAARSARITAAYGGKSGAVDLTQAANSWYDKRIELFGGATSVGAAGGMIYFSTTVYRGWSSGAESVGGSGLGALSGSATGFSVNGLALIAAHRGTTPGDARAITICAVYGGLTSNTMTVTQAANAASYNSLAVSVEGWTGSAAGETRSLRAIASYSYTSGSTSAPDVTGSTSFTGSATGFTVSGSQLSSQHRSTTLGGARSITVTGSYGGRSGSVTVTQAANEVTNITYGNWSFTCSVSNHAASSGGDTLYLTANCPTRPMTYYYTSGVNASGGNQSAYGQAGYMYCYMTYGSGSGFGTFSWPNLDTSAYRYDNLTITNPISFTRNSSGSARSCRVNVIWSSGPNGTGTQYATWSDPTMISQSVYVKPTVYFCIVVSASGSEVIATSVNGSVNPIAVASDVYFTYDSETHPTAYSYHISKGSSSSGYIERVPYPTTAAIWFGVGDTTYSDDTYVYVLGRMIQ